MKKEKLITECPNCGCEEFWYDDWEYDAEYANRDIECMCCGAMWTWTFKFKENTILYKGDPQKPLTNK